VPEPQLRHVSANLALLSLLLVVLVLLQDSSCCLASR
jgi:hypothetical protein